MQQRLQPREVADELEESEHPHDPDQPNDLSGLADDLIVLEAGQQEGDVEGEDGGEINHVHRLLDESQLVWADYQPDEILNALQFSLYWEGNLKNLSYFLNKRKEFELKTEILVTFNIL